MVDDEKLSGQQIESKIIENNDYFVVRILLSLFTDTIIEN
jgi:hypothetical protein